MKKFILSAALSVVSLAAFAQEKTQANLSPFTRLYLQKIAEHTALPVEGYVYKTDALGQHYISGIIKISNAAQAAEALQQLHVSVGTKAGDIWTVQVPVEKVIGFTKVGGVEYIQLDEPFMAPAMDQARIKTRVDSVQKGINLPMKYSGKGVVVGIIDFGFDYNHPTFFDTLGGQFRIRKVWELGTTGTPPTGYLYGHEITDSNLIKTQGTDNPKQIHGTDVAGMSSGSGWGSPTAGTKFRGMAYESDMIMVGVRRDSIGPQWQSSGFSDFIDGVNYIFTSAAAMGKPVVCNISWGSQSGPHDGTTLFNQACNNLTGPGKIVVLSAGNDGQEKIHIYKGFTAADTMVQTFLSFTSPAYKRTWVDIWGDTGKNFSAKVQLYHNGVAGATTTFYNLDNQIHTHNIMGANNTDTCYVQFITATSEFNQKPRMIISIFNKATDSVLVSVKSNDGTIDMWNEYYYYGFPYKFQSEFVDLGQSFAVNGNTQSTTSDMGSGAQALLVGAYVSKKTFTNILGQSLTYSAYPLNGLANFSSRGPMANGTIKPDITAPGLTIATAVSSYDTSYSLTGTNAPLTSSSFTHPVTNKTYYYAEFSGTSAAAPAASGIIALLLQAKPNMTPTQLKSILYSTAIADIYTGTLPAAGNNDWGHGKINAYGAMKKAIELAGVTNVNERELDCVIYPNPNNGAFAIDCNSTGNSSMKVELSDITGKMIGTENWNLHNGYNSRQFSFSGLNTGIYFVRLSSESGSSTYKIVVQ